MDWSSFLENYAQSALESGLNATYQFALSSGTYRKQKKLLNEQAKLQQEYYQLQNARQDYLLQNADMIRKQSLARAGYSTADPNGTGTTPAQTMSVPNVSTPGFSMPNINASSVRDIASMHLEESQADYYDALRRKTQSEAEILELDLQKYRDTYETQVASIMSQYYNLTKQNRKLDTEIDYTSGQTSKIEDERKLLQKQASEVEERIKNFAASTANIRIDTKFKQATFDDRVKTITTELEKLQYEKDIAGSTVIIKRVESQLAEVGILNGQGMIQTLCSLAALGRGDLAVKGISQFLQSALQSLTQELPSVLGTFINSAYKIIEDAIKKGALVPAF